MKLRAIILILAVLAVGMATAGGMYVYISFKDAGIEDIHREVDANVETLAGQISVYLDVNLRTVQAMAGVDYLRRALEGQNGDLDRVNDLLDHFHEAMKVDICYLLDEHGNTIASSNRNDPDSLVGKNYAFRPYFRQAMTGVPSVYLALGVTTHKMGVYYSYPVYGIVRDKPVGVAVIKMPLDYLEEKIGRYPDGIMLVADRSGVIFMSNRKDWIYRMLWRVTPEVTAGIAASRQFGAGPWEWTGMEKKEAGIASDGSGGRHMVHESLVRNSPGWKVTGFYDMNPASKRIYTPMLRNIGVAALASCVMLGLIVWFLYVKADREIALRKDAEDNLQRERDKIRKYLDTAGVMLTVLDASGRVVMLNRTGREMLGCDDRSVTGLDWFENFVPKRIRDDMKSTFHHLMDGDLGRFENFESSVMTMNGQERIVLFHNAILDDKNGVVNGILFSGTDITERKRIEDELLVARKLESVGILAGGIAHDFNNLLNAILGYISLAKMNLGKDDWIYKLLDESEKASIKAGMLTRRLITFSEGGRPVITEVSVPEIIRNMDCASLSPEGSVSCKFRVTGDSWKIRADEGQIEQVIGNMLANAREAMPAGGEVELLVENVVVTADDGLPLADGKYVRFSVKDTGAGIPPENLPKIFDPYFTTKEMGTKRGVGLGLAICRSIVMKHHGLITVESEAGKGTIFHVYLPAVV